METNILDDDLSVFVNVRARLFGIAYRLLGSAVEAEDIVQDVWMRWQSTDRSVVRDAPAFLATTTRRLAINVAQSARWRCETYVGSWLREPVDTNADPGLRVERVEAFEFAILLLLEKLSPPERAAYVLREAFDYRYRQIAGILHLSEANSRQLVARARKHISKARNAAVSSVERHRLLNAFIAAIQKGDLLALESLLRRTLSPTRMPTGSCSPLSSRSPIVTKSRSSSRWSLHTSRPGVRVGSIKAN